ncbi:hypothetical protein Kpho01_26450 [Kitasatospora phosalacinea]|uniref:Excalibur calcium-binding domain-containing protein n=1 Tax=Kitasatospora phosalacinea TaxID=2065 RepID=A0A9W6PGQ0_9ACTN|nr:hypothetical protein Kpho01_26450 [Kitasatospora phosalacinea]
MLLLAWCAVMSVFWLAAVLGPDEKDAADTPAPAVTTEQAAAYYKNCTEAKAAGAAPLHAGDPGYRSALDRDGDGVACEK